MWTWRAVLHPEDLDRVARGELAAGWLDLSYEMTTLRPESAYADVTPRLVVEELLLFPSQQTRTSTGRGQGTEPWRGLRPR